MIQRWCLLAAVIAACFGPAAAYPETAVKIVVLPFTIHADTALSYLDREIPALIARMLAEEGAEVIDPEPAVRDDWQAAGADPQKARRIGLMTGADFVVWGSFTRLGQAFSLDASLIQPFVEEPPALFFKEDKGIENLLPTVQKLAREIAMTIFKRERIAAIRITGNRRIENDAILRYIRTKPGDAYHPKQLSDDLKSVYSMGYFEDIRVEYTDNPEGKIVTFHVVEKPTIRKIKFKGNSVFEDQEIADTLDIQSGSILNIFKIQNNIARIENLYKEKNYHNVQIDHRVQSLDNNQGDLMFVIEEGEKIRITRVIFEGNRAYTDRELKRRIKTNEKGFFYWITTSGELKREALQQDALTLADFYHNNGYIEAKIGEPEVIFMDGGMTATRRTPTRDRLSGLPLTEYNEQVIHIIFKIDEGRRYKVGQVDVKGDLIEEKSVLSADLKISEETYYSREVVRNDVLTLTDRYGNEGYAYADIFPKIDRHEDTLTVDITYNITKGKQVYFEEIVITGNAKTRDKVIRRELDVYEQELYSGKGLKRGIRNLYRLDFFEDIRVDTLEGSRDDTMLLKIEVAEKPTGSFALGGGYSSVEYAYGTASVTQRNLFGRGQVLNLNATISAKSSTYTLGFTEPWLFDTRVSAGFDLYQQQRDYDSYEKESFGIRPRLGFPVADYTRLYFSYLYDISNVYNIADDVSRYIDEMQGSNVTSSITTTLKRDSRDRVFNASEGSLNSAGVEYAGLGGDIKFTKYTCESGWFFPLIGDTIGSVHGEAGYVHENEGGLLPDYERFYMGGMHTIRGFKWRDIHAEDEDGEEVGGDKKLQFNFEWIVPLIKEAGVVGVLFLDVGNVYGKGEPIDLSDTREGGGAGFRWYSPVGPIRLEYGWILDPRNGESTSGRWEFAIGTVF